MKPEFFLLSERSIVIQFGTAICLEANIQVKQLFYQLRQAKPEWLIDSIPAYISLTIEFDPFQITFEALRIQILFYIENSFELPKSVYIRIPVCYDEDFGIDLSRIAAAHKITPKSIIELHSAKTYPVFMIGFTPGFPYLGEVSEKIAMPRLASPRLKIEAGSVGIAQRQTGVYPQSGPSGWNIIGRVPISIFDETNGPLIHLNHIVKFIPIDMQTFQGLQQNPRLWRLQ